MFITYVLAFPKLKNVDFAVICDFYVDNIEMPRKPQQPLSSVLLTSGDGSRNPLSTSSITYI